MLKYSGFNSFDASHWNSFARNFTPNPSIACFLGQNIKKENNRYRIFFLETPQTQRTTQDTYTTEHADKPRHFNYTAHIAMGETAASHKRIIEKVDGKGRCKKKVPQASNTESPATKRRMRFAVRRQITLPLSPAPRAIQRVYVNTPTIYTWLTWRELATNLRGPVKRDGRFSEADRQVKKTREQHHFGHRGHFSRAGGRTRTSMWVTT